MTDETVHGRPVVDHSTTSRVNARIIGGLFLLFGILGFVPGAIDNPENLQFITDENEAVVLLGLFQVSVLHNLLHLVFGVAGLLMARDSGLASVGFLLFVGLFLLAVSLYSFFTASQVDVNFIPFNSADSWLHLVLGLVMFTMGIYGRRHLRLSHDDALLPPTPED